MSDFYRICRQQLLREAEGYLDLVMIFADQWPPRASTRDRLCRRALELLASIEDPGVDRGYVKYLWGQALRTMEKYADAIGPLLESAEDDPGNVHIWLALGWCYKRVRRLDLAIESLEEAASIDPGQAIVHYNLACYWSLVGDVDHAVHHLVISFDMDTNYRDLVPHEHDFDRIRSDPQFQTVTSVVV